MPTICGTKATVLASCAAAGPAAAAKSTTAAEMSFSVLDMVQPLCNRRAFLCGAFECPRVGMGTRDEGHDLLRIGVASPSFGDLAAAAEHRHAIRDLEHVGDVVADQDDRTAAV